MIGKVATVFLICTFAFGGGVAATVGYDWWQSRDVANRVIVASTDQAAVATTTTEPPTATTTPPEPATTEPPTATTTPPEPATTEPPPATTTPPEPATTEPPPATTTPPEPATTEPPPATATPQQAAPTAAERAAYVIELMTGRVETDQSVFARHCNTTRSGGVAWTTDPDYQWEGCLLPDETATVPDAQQFIYSLDWHNTFVKVVVEPGAIAAGCVDAPPDIAGCARMAENGLFTIYMDEPRRSTLAHEYAHLWGNEHDLTYRCAALWGYEKWVENHIAGWAYDGIYSIESNAKSILESQSENLPDPYGFTRDVMDAAAPHCEAAGVWRYWTEEGHNWSEFMLPPQNNVIRVTAVPPTLPIPNEP